MENVKPDLQPAPLPEGGGGEALMQLADIPTSNGSDTQFFKKSCGDLWCLQPRSQGRRQSNCSLFLMAQDPELIPVWGNCEPLAV